MIGPAYRHENRYKDSRSRENCCWNRLVPNSRADTSGTIDKKLISGVSIGVSLSWATRVEIIMVSRIGAARVGSPQSRGWREEDREEEKEREKEIRRKRLSPPPWQWQMDGDFNQWMESPLANRVFLLPHCRSSVAFYACICARPWCVGDIYSDTPQPVALVTERTTSDGLVSCLGLFKLKMDTSERRKEVPTLTAL